MAMSSFLRSAGIDQSDALARFGPTNYYVTPKWREIFRDRLVTHSVAGMLLWLDNQTPCCVIRSKAGKKAEKLEDNFF
jgi:hypothetical protein